jgi:hypothetical protein
MPLVTETVIDALAHCADQRCAGYTQQPVKAVQTVTQFSYIDLGGDLPGIERESFLLRFDDIADTQCPHCGEPRIVADQTRPIYPNVSGQPQDALLQPAPRRRARARAGTGRRSPRGRNGPDAGHDGAPGRGQRPADGPPGDAARTRARKDEPQA